MINYGIQPPQFKEEDYDKKSWFSAIAQYAQSQTGVVSQTSSYNVAWDVGMVRIDATTGAKTVKFPLSENSKGREIGVIKTDASASTVSVITSGSDVVNGTSTLSAQWASGVYRADGTTNWDKLT